MKLGLGHDVILTCRAAHNVRNERWQRMGSEAGRQKVTATVRPSGRHRKAPPERGFSLERLKGFEPSTFCMASRRSSQLSYSRTGGSLPGRFESAVVVFGLRRSGRGCELGPPLR